MMIRMKASDPDTDYKKFAFLADAIAKLTNPHIFWDLRGMPEAERLADLAELKDIFEDLTH